MLCFRTGCLTSSVKTMVGGGAPGSVIHGARTEVMMGNPDSRGPGILTHHDLGRDIDLDRVEADLAMDSSFLSQGGRSGGQLPGSSPAQNIKSKFACDTSLSPTTTRRGTGSPSCVRATG